MSNILVTSGNIGSVVAERLLREGHNVTLLVRSREQNEILEELGVTYAVVDATKADSLGSLFNGIDAFFFVSPLVENMVVMANNLIEAAKEAQIKHIVRSSANGASSEAPIAMGKLHGQVEELIKSSGIPYTILQPATFYQNILGSLQTIKAEKAFYGSTGEGKNALVDIRDIASVAVKVLSEGQTHFGKTYIITGPKAISNNEVASVLSKGIGREVHYVNLKPEVLGEAYKSYGMLPWTIHALLELDNITSLGYVSNVSDDVKKVTGKDPIPFEQFVEDYAGLFRD